ncbi:MAG: insulinase family protein [Acidobacteria bacterium]|nr:insulinase family protein [Acidobacteriota bacterium]
MNRIRYGAAIAAAGFLLVSLGLPQSRRSGRRAAPEPRAPFLLESLSYEEAAPGARAVLKNGMTVLVHETRTAPLVAVRAYVSRVGPLAADDTLAELMGALVCRGGESGGAGTFRQRVHALGGVFSRSTDPGHNLLEIVAPADRWRQALVLQADAMGHPSFDPEVVRSESSLLAAEARARRAQPGEAARAALFEEGSGRAAPGRDGEPTAGDPEGIRAAFAAAYTPAAMTLVVAGDVRSSDILNEIVRLYDMSPKPPVRASGRPARRPEGFRYRALRREGPQAGILFGFRTGAAGGGDSAATEVLAALLGGGRSSALEARWGEREGLLLGARALVADAREMLLLEAETDGADIDRAELAVMTEIERIKRREPERAEMERAIGCLERSYWRALETVGGRAALLARCEFSGNWKRMQSYPSEWRRVEAREVRQAAVRYLGLDNGVLVECLPGSAGARSVTAAVVKKTLEGLLPAALEEAERKREKEVVYAPVLPEERGRFEPSEVQYPLRTASILRGPELYIQEDHSTPVIDLGLFYPGGRRAETAENAGITALMLEAMMPPAALRQVEILGGAVESVAGDDFFGVFLSVPSANFEAALEPLSRAIRDPEFVPEAVAWKKRVRSAELAGRKDSLDAGMRGMEGVLFRDSAYALTGGEEASALPALTAEDLELWHRETMRRRKPVVAAVGDTTGTALAARFVKDFSGSRMLGEERKGEFVEPLEKGSVLEAGGARPGRMLIVGYPAPPEEDEDLYALRVLEGYLGGMGRLAQQLRDRLGVAWHADFVLRPRLLGGSVAAVALTGDEGGEGALEAMRAELDAVGRRPPASHDFRAAQAAAAGMHRIRRQERHARILEMVRHFMAGKGLDEYREFERNLGGVTGEDFTAAAARILRPERAVVLKIGERAGAGGAAVPETRGEER